MNSVVQMNRYSSTNNRLYGIMEGWKNVTPTIIPTIQSSISNFLRIVFMLVSIVLIFSTTASAQTQEGQDPKAKAILDGLSKKTKSYLSILSEFTMVMESKDKKTTETQKGKLQLKGEKYKLEIKGQDIICDGKTVWTYLKDAKEVQINNVDLSSNEGVTPSTIFTVYEKGYKYKLDGEKAGIQMISLFPLDPGSKKFHTLKIDINKAKKQIIGFKVFMKDGSIFTYTINKFTPNGAVNDAAFGFDPKLYPGVEIVDLRD